MLGSGGERRRWVSSSLEQVVTFFAFSRKLFLPFHELKKRKRPKLKSEEEKNIRNDFRKQLQTSNKKKGTFLIFKLPMKKAENCMRINVFILNFWNIQTQILSNFPKTFFLSRPSFFFSVRPDGLTIFVKICGFFFLIWQKRMILTFDVQSGFFEQKSNFLIPTRFCQRILKFGILGPLVEFASGGSKGRGGGGSGGNPIFWISTVV